MGEKALLLGKEDLRGVVLGDLEALQQVPRSPCLHRIVKLQEGHDMPPWDQPEPLEARELVEKPGQREFVGLLAGWGGARYDSVGFLKEAGWQHLVRPA